MRIATEKRYEVNGDEPRVDLIAEDVRGLVEQMIAVNRGKRQKVTIMIDIEAP